MVLVLARRAAERRWLLMGGVVVFEAFLGLLEPLVEGSHVVLQGVQDALCLPGVDHAFLGSPQHEVRELHRGANVRPQHAHPFESRLSHNVSLRGCKDHRLVDLGLGLHDATGLLARPEASVVSEVVQQGFLALGMSSHERPEYCDRLQVLGEVQTEVLFGQPRSQFLDELCQPEDAHDAEDAEDAVHPQQSGLSGHVLLVHVLRGQGHDLDAEAEEAQDDQGKVKEVPATDEVLESEDAQLDQELHGEHRVEEDLEDEPGDVALVVLVSVGLLHHYEDGVQ
mmetsp:Transcript_132435/g.411703  ORF Transcript_132435/g.411703 Transcript_132435/m.411703 type:complete len:282 (+) Transcript_132435:459-1304(+)